MGLDLFVLVTAMLLCILGGVVLGHLVTMMLFVKTRVRCGSTWCRSNIEGICSKRTLLIDAQAECQVSDEKSPSVIAGILKTHWQERNICSTCSGIKTRFICPDCKEGMCGSCDLKGYVSYCSVCDKRWTETLRRWVHE